MLPESRLANLLQSVKQNQIDTCRYHTAPSSPSLYTDHVCPRSLFPTECAVELDDLSVEAWQVQYSPTGHLLAACGLNGVAIWDSNFKLVGELRAHQRGVANVAWSPDGTMLVTCSQDKTARLWRVSVGYHEPQQGRMPPN